MLCLSHSVSQCQVGKNKILEMRCIFIFNEASGCHKCLWWLPAHQSLDASPLGYNKVAKYPLRDHLRRLIYGVQLFPNGTVSHPLDINNNKILFSNVEDMQNVGGFSICICVGGLLEVGPAWFDSCVCGNNSPPSQPLFGPRSGTSHFLEQIRQCYSMFVRMPMK